MKNKYKKKYQNEKVGRMGDCGQRVGVFRSGVILSNDQVRRLATEVETKVMMRTWESRLLFMTPEVVQNLETKGETTIQKEVSFP